MPSHSDHRLPVLISMFTIGDVILRRSAKSDGQKPSNKRQAVCCRDKEERRRRTDVVKLRER